MKQVVVSLSFDDWNSAHVRLLDESSRLGRLNVVIWSDEDVESITGESPKFPLEERRYFVESCRYVDGEVCVSDGNLNVDAVPWIGKELPDVWAMPDQDADAGRRESCRKSGVALKSFDSGDLNGFPVSASPLEPEQADTAIATGCYDWFHSGHIRFFEEASSVAPLDVVIGSDKNVRLLKGEGHPFFSEQERLYMVQSIKFVHRAFISSGRGWMDAAPEIEKIRPTYYVVNEDGDKGEKAKFCTQHGLQYTVLKRTPKEGLPRRESTRLRGF